MLRGLETPMRRFDPLLILTFSLIATTGCPGGDDDSTGDDDSNGDDDDSVEPCVGVEPVSGTGVQYEEVASGFSSPVHVTHSGDGTGRLFVVEQDGRVMVVEPNGDSAEYYDMRSLTDGGGEQGLLSIAFHPDFATNGHLFLSYTDNGGDSVISRVTVDGDPLTDEPDEDSEVEVLTQNQPYANHNGGQIAFGPDGMLYIGFGDGGAADDPQGFGQNPESFLGKMLRIDVDNGDPYDVPSDNPFVDDDDFEPEIWAWGLRNPWRFSFDRETGEMWIGDVGQNEWEEIDRGVAGANYGWADMEADDCRLPGGCSTEDYEGPVHVFSHSSGGVSVTGGFVYRGCRMPDLRGQYFFSDFNYVNSPLWTLRQDNSEGDVTDNSTGSVISSFGEDEQGEIHFLDYFSGTLFRIEPD